MLWNESKYLSKQLPYWLKYYPLYTKLKESPSESIIFKSILICPWLQTRKSHYITQEMNVLHRCVIRSLDDKQISFVQIDDIMLFRKSIYSIIVENLFSVNCQSFFRLENGWFVREVPSPVQTGGTSSTVPSTPPSDGEHEILVLNGDISEMRSKDHRNPESNKQTKKVCV